MSTLREQKGAFGRKKRPDPDRAPFSSFLDRDAARAAKEKRRTRTLVLSVAFHVVAVAGLLFYSFWHVEDLFGPSVKVTVYKPSKAPREAGGTVKVAPAPEQKLAPAP